MANPQLEDGYTQIANEILENLMLYTCQKINGKFFYVLFVKHTALRKKLIGLLTSR
jgi:hypothetical protein